MGFPDDWLIEPLRNVSGLAATWGKGITVDCGRWIGGWAKAALDESPGSFRGVEIGEREFLIDSTYSWSQNLVQSNSTLKKFRKLLGGKIMTEPEAPVVPTVEGDETVAVPEASKTSAGRPRPQATIDRDEVVLNHLANLPEEFADGQTKEQISAALGLAPNVVYLSLWRLKRDNKIHKSGAGGAARWSAGAAPEQAEVPEEQAAAPVEETVAI